MDAIDQMFRVLVRTLRTKQPALLTAPFTVAELYQQILPYRHYRRELALETNQEYEITLMELLSGARGYLDVDEQLRDELGKELKSPSPEPSRVREFADAHVAISSAALATVFESTSGVASPARGNAPAAVPGMKAATATPASMGSTMHSPPGAIGRVGLPEATRASVADAAGSEHRCRYCGGDLPAGRVLHFCPHCGQNLQVLNCPACGAEVEAGWKFCVACGKAVS
jgi:hypothetical protein